MKNRNENGSFKEGTPVTYIQRVIHAGMSYSEVAVSGKISSHFYDGKGEAMYSIETDTAFKVQTTQGGTFYIMYAVVSAETVRVKV